MRLEGSGWFACPNVIWEESDPLLDLYAKAIWTYLYRRAGPDGASWPSYKKMATDCGMSRRQAMRAVKTLIGWKFVRKKDRVGSTGSRSSNSYELTLGGDYQAPGVVTASHQGGDYQSPEVPLSEVPPKESLSQSSKSFDLLSLWNEVVKIPMVRVLTRARAEKMRIRLREHPDLDWWRAVFEEIRGSNFLRGSKGWRATFNWIIENEENAVKVLEGNYREETMAEGAARLKELAFGEKAK